MKPKQGYYTDKLLQELVETETPSPKRHKLSEPSSSVQSLLQTHPTCAAITVTPVDDTVSIDDFTTPQQTRSAPKAAKSNEGTRLLVIDPNLVPTHVQLTGEQFCYTAARMENLLQVFFKAAPQNVMANMLQQMETLPTSGDLLSTPRTDQLEEKYQEALRAQLFALKEKEDLLGKISTLNTILSSSREQCRDLEKQVQRYEDKARTNATSRLATEEPHHATQRRSTNLAVGVQCR